MGHNAAIRKIKSDKGAALRWVEAHKEDAADILMLQNQGMTRAQAYAYLVGLFEPIKVKRTLPQALKRLLMSLPALLGLDALRRSR